MVAEMKRRLVIPMSLFIASVTFALPAAAANNKPNPAVDKIFSDLTQPGSPGCALAVYRNGSIVYSKGYGLASTELDVPITPQTVFDIGSMSKQFTAASILLLEEQGKLSLTDDVRKYIPELPDYGHKITILNLLNHTSGIRDYLALFVLAGVHIDSVTTDQDALALIARQKHLNFTPGSRYLYSNSGFFLLSLIVKRVSGVTLEQFALKNIFQPLGMSQTTYRDDHTLLLPHRALAYDPAGPNKYKLDVSYFEQTGDGAVHTSVDDLVKWDENFYTGKVGGQRLIREIQERGKLNDGKTIDYAKGLMIESYRGLPTVQHGGAWGGYRGQLLRFPQQHFSVASLCNLSNANPERRADKVADVYLGSLMTPEKAVAPATEAAKVTLTPEQTQRVVGLYRNSKDGSLMRIASKDGKLQWELFGQTFALNAISPTELVPVKFPLEARLTAESGADKAIRGVKITGDEEISGNFQKVAEFKPSAAELADFAGDYYSDELAVVYHLRVKDGKLSLVGISERSGIPRTGLPLPMTLRPSIQDEFELTDLGVRADFQKNTTGQIVGFDLNEGRSNGISFQRMDAPEKR